MDVLTHAVLHRPERRTKEGDGQSERISIDFVVNGASLIQQLARCSGGKVDRMGPLGKGWLPKFRAAAITKLCGEAPPETDTGRFIFYFWGEGGALGCGAFTGIIERVGDTCIWRSFAEENGYEPAIELESVGPFTFRWREYLAALRAADAALDQYNPRPASA